MTSQGTTSRQGNFYILQSPFSPNFRESLLAQRDLVNQDIILEHTLEIHRESLEKFRELLSLEISEGYIDIVDEMVMSKYENIAEFLLPGGERILFVLTEKGQALSEEYGMDPIQLIGMRIMNSLAVFMETDDLSVSTSDTPGGPVTRIAIRPPYMDKDKDMDMDSTDPHPDSELDSLENGE